MPAICAQVSPRGTARFRTTASTGNATSIATIAAPGFSQEILILGTETATSLGRLIGADGLKKL